MPKIDLYTSFLEIYLKFSQFFEAWDDVELDSVNSAGQGNTSYQQDSQDKVWERCSKMHHLSGGEKQFR